MVRFTESGMTLSGELLILDGPDLTGATNHNGGTLRFAPDGTLFISIGDNDTDALANPLSRDLGDPRGKLLRINADGSIPPDNPFVGQPGVLPEIWAWGLRNPFRFGIDSDSGAPLIGDVGEGSWEAVYLGVAGADYGYPCVEGSAPFRVCDPAPPAGTVTAPIFVYSHGAATPPVSGNSITGGPVYRHGAFPPEYLGAYFFGDYVDGWMRRGRLDPAGQLVEVEMFIPDAAAVVDMVVSPGGCLTWVGLSGGGVNEVCYVGGGNGQPQARASAAPRSGLVNLDVQFTGSLSTDPDGEPLAYSWQFGDGGASALADPSHLYTANGVYAVELTVDDQQGAANSLDAAPPLRIVVGNRAPAATITAPGAGSTYDAGETIAFAGSASDPEDGPLEADRLAWTIVFHHGSHVHPFLGPITGVAGGELTIPASGEDAADVFYRIHLTATDSGAPLGAAAELSDSVSVDLLPNVSQITLVASPPGFGLELEYEQQAAVAPSSHDSVVGVPRTLGAPTPQTTGGRSFQFHSWSDGGAAEHTIVTPVADTVYTATFAINCISPDTVVLSNDTVDGPESHEACISITVGPAYEIVDGGDLTLTAGQLVKFNNGLTVAEGGILTVVNQPMF